MRVAALDHGFHAYDQVQKIASTMNVWDEVTRRNVEVLRICAASDERMAERLTELSSPVTVEPLIVRPIRPVAFSRFVGLTNALKVFRPDVIHVWAEPWQLALRQATSVAHRLHASLGVHLAENGPALRGVVGNYRRLAGRISLNKVDYAISWSHASARLVRESFGYGGAVQHFPAVGVPKIFYELPVAPRRDRRALFIGRFVEGKGVHDLLSIAPQLRSRNISLTMIGTGPLLPKIQAASAGGLLELTNWLPRDDLAKHVRRARVTVLPSRSETKTSILGIETLLEEQFGRVAAESLAAGTPVVAYDTGELKYVIGGGGIVVPQGDTEGMLKAVELLVNNDEVWQERSEAARKQARGYADSAIADRLVNIWSQLPLL